MGCIYKGKWPCGRIILELSGWQVCSKFRKSHLEYFSSFLPWGLVLLFCYRICCYIQNWSFRSGDFTFWTWRQRWMGVLEWFRKRCSVGCDWNIGRRCKGWTLKYYQICEWHYWWKRWILLMRTGCLQVFYSQNFVCFQPGKRSRRWAQRQNTNQDIFLMWWFWMFHIPPQLGVWYIEGSCG